MATSDSGSDSESEYEYYIVPSTWWGRGLRKYEGMYVESDYVEPDHMPLFSSYVNEHKLLCQLDGIQSKQELLKNRELLIQLNRELRDPTSCHFDTADYDEVFFADQQGALQWIMDERDGTVWVKEKPYPVLVSPSVQDFFARWLMENNIFNKLRSHDDLDMKEQEYLKATSECIRGPYFCNPRKAGQLLSRNRSKNHVE